MSEQDEARAEGSAEGPVAGGSRAELPRSLRRPRSRNRFVDLFLDAAFTFTGPAQVGTGEGPQRGPRTEEEARAGYGEWERVTIDGHSYLVEKRPPQD